MSDEYLAEADEAGLLRTIGGHAYVAGPYTNPSTGVAHVLVEYCAPEIVREPAKLAALTEQLELSFGIDQPIVLRVDGAVELPEPWRQNLTYVRYVAPEPPAHDGADCVIAPAAAEHLPQVTEWLVRALADAVEDARAEADLEGLRTLAKSIVEMPGRVSYVAVRDGVAVGHLTLNEDAWDDVRGASFVELLDSLVEEVPGKRQVLDALTAAAVGHAAGRGPLVGHVVHGKGELVEKNAQRVVESLLRKGWVVDHRYWIRGGSDD